MIRYVVKSVQILIITLFFMFNTSTKDCDIFTVMEYETGSCTTIAFP